MIRTAAEIQTIINKAQHALADAGIEIAEMRSAGVEDTDPDLRDKIYKLDLLYVFLQNILDAEGNVTSYYQAPENTKKFNDILDGLASLAGIASGVSVPLIGRRLTGIIYYPSSAGGSGGQQPVTPGGTTFQNLSVDSPGEIVDQFDANISSFAHYIYSVQGQNPGEGNRSGFFTLAWRGTDVVISGDAGTPPVGGTTAGVSFSAAIVSGRVQLTCNVPSSNWIVRGTRILFQNSSFLSQQGDFPNGIRANVSGPFWGVMEVPLPAWNMDVNNEADIALVAGLRAIVLGVEIIDDNGDTYFNLDAWNPAAERPDGGWRYTQQFGTLNLRRRAGGVYDQSAYSSTSMSRGKATVLYYF